MPVGPEETPIPRKRPSGRRLSDRQTLPRTGITLGEARARLSGLHFTKEALTQGERDILYVAEGLLRLIDGERWP